MKKKTWKAVAFMLIGFIIAENAALLLGKDKFAKDFESNSSVEQHFPGVPPFDNVEAFLVVRDKDGFSNGVESYYGATTYALDEEVTEKVVEVVNEYIYLDYLMDEPAEDKYSTAEGGAFTPYKSGRFSRSRGE